MQEIEFSKDNPFTLDAKPSEVLEYISRIENQYGSMHKFCKLNKLPLSFFHRMYRASFGSITPSNIAALNMSLAFYHKDIMLSRKNKELGQELYDKIKSNYNSISEFCLMNNLSQREYQKIAGFISGRRKSLDRNLINIINTLKSKKIRNEKY